MPGPTSTGSARSPTYLDDPQLTYPTIHVTGTNGKTTAARRRDAVACAHGLTTGLFTSPHLVVGDRAVRGLRRRHRPRRSSATSATHLQPYLRARRRDRDGRVTYFEALTALAFLWFADKPVGLGVFEVGMGGSWDATNLVAGDVAVLDAVGLDHVAELGSTLADIAGEKAGIVKEGKIAVVREQDAGGRSRCSRRAPPRSARRCCSRCATGRSTSRSLAVGGQAFDAAGARTRPTRTCSCRCSATTRSRNAAAGDGRVRGADRQALDEDGAREGLAGVRRPGGSRSSAASPLIVLDGAHNPAGRAALADALREFVHLGPAAPRDGGEREQGRRPARGAARGARRRGATRRATTACGAPSRGGRPAAAAGRGRRSRVHDRRRRRWRAARAAAGRGDAIVVTGSLFTVGDAKRALA